MKRLISMAAVCSLILAVSCSESSKVIEKEFTYNAPKEAIAGQAVKFEDLSLGVASREWTFEDAEPATSKAAVVDVTFKNGGEKAVKLVVNFSDGRRGIKVLPRILQRITKYYNLMLLSSDIDSIDLYMSCDPFFGRYPNSGALKVYAIDPSDLKEHLRDASGMKCDGATVEICK